MKVNITGKGIIPGIGTLAPKYNVEMNKDQIKRILEFPHYHQLVITDVETNLVVTSKNIDTFFNKPIITELPKVQSISVPKKVNQPAKVAPKSEQVVGFSSTVEEAVATTTEPLPEITEPDMVVEVTSTSERIGNVHELEEYVPAELTIEPLEEVLEEEEESHYNKKKKKNRR